MSYDRLTKITTHFYEDGKVLTSAEFVTTLGNPTLSRAPETLEACDARLKAFKKVDATTPMRTWNQERNFATAIKLWKQHLTAEAAKFKPSNADTPTLRRLRNEIAQELNRRDHITFERDAAE